MYINKEKRYNKKDVYSMKNINVKNENGGK